MVDPYGLAAGFLLADEDFSKHFKPKEFE